MQNDNLISFKAFNFNIKKIQNIKNIKQHFDSDQLSYYTS